LDGPHLIASAPIPTDDYAGFCEYVAQKDFKLRITIALASLGFTSDLLACVHSALDVVENPDTGYDKDTAVKYVGACTASVIADHSSTNDPEAFLSRVAHRVECVCDTPELFNLDSRTRFAMMDLGRAIAKTNVADTRKVTWSTSRHRTRNRWTQPT
jgi:hypothetical protein